MMTGTNQQENGSEKWPAIIRQSLIYSPKGGKFTWRDDRPGSHTMFDENARRGSSVTLERNGWQEPSITVPYKSEKKAFKVGQLVAFFLTGKLDVPYSFRDLNPHNLKADNLRIEQGKQSGTGDSAEMVSHKLAQRAKEAARSNDTLKWRLVLRSSVDYSPETGELAWKRDRPKAFGYNQATTDEMWNEGKVRFSGPGHTEPTVDVPYEKERKTFKAGQIAAFFKSGDINTQYSFADGNPRNLQERNINILPSEQGQNR